VTVSREEDRIQQPDKDVNMGDTPQDKDVISFVKALWKMMDQKWRTRCIALNEALNK
jgi:hypothetical protein